MHAVVHELAVHRLNIPLRTRVTHAAAQRSVADPVIVRVEFRHGALGFGEAVPRSYVTGETVNTVVAAIEDTFLPYLVSFHAESLPDALEAIDALPWQDPKGHLVPAARAAVELALLDASLKTFDRRVEHVVQWMGLPRFGNPGSLRTVRFSAIFAGESSQNFRRRLRKYVWAGLRDFKLKVGLAEDCEHLEILRRSLGRSLDSGRRTLRIDTNGTWTKDDAIKWFKGVPPVRIAAVEQPLAKGDEEWVVVHEAVGLPIIHDESLVTLADARGLIDRDARQIFNIRMSKCGGLLPSLRIAELARRSGTRVVLGCMVGETSVLAAAGRRFLEVCPDVQWAEGCFGDRLLQRDVTRKSLKFGYGGRVPRIPERGLGVSVLESRLQEFADEPPKVFRL